MEVHNNFSPLAFRKKESKATYEKWYAFGKNYAIPASANTLTPFQFTELNIPVFDPDTIEVEAVNEETGEPKKTGVYVSFDVMPEHGGVLYVSPGKNSFREALPQGTYRARFSIGDEVYISTPFCVIPGIETSSKYLLIEYWNDEEIAYPGGFITTGANNDFKYQMYVPATICKPKYEFEEELTKRAGYKFLELQTSTKVYAFTFVAPEFICDAMRLIRLSDYIRISHDGEYYNALNFEFDVDWQEQLYLAAVDCQFETDSIIQKLPSFNRRDKASFYNALLANIDTPIMFSPDTVGLYYKEYRETEPVVKGKLIRELSPIDLIDKNTTIAVDLGTGEARKFNLYRMLQDYISKAHEDATDFLLHLRGGATFGEGITGSAASINAVGDAKVKSLDSEYYVTVNKTAFTVNKQGDTALNALNARGDSHLQQDVYTGNNTGKITKEGQLQYLSAVIQEFITSPTFVPGFLGEGFKIWVENGNWHIECDNLTVRQTMNIFELLIQKIRSVNGALVVSQSNGKIKSVSEDETNYVITMEEEGEMFQPNDLVRCQVWTGSKTKFYWVEVASVSGNSITVKKSEFTAGNKPEKGDEVVQMGNTQNAQRQALIYITAQESGHPYIEILNGVKTKSLSGTNRTRLGDLSNIQDSAFPEGQQPSGSGLYCDNAFLRGIFLLRNGKSVEDEVNQAKQDAANAATEAERAQQTAQEAKDRLNKWADDGFISPTEKPALIDEGKRIQAEFLQIKNNADKYGVSVTEYTKAYEDYLNELRYHSAQQPEDIAVRPELAQSQTAYYDKRNGALNEIATASKEYVDNADKQLKEYLDTEITAIPGKIELAVRSSKVADVNLLKGAYKELKNAGYIVGHYFYDVPVINGKDYTLTICYTLSDANTRIEAYSNGGTNFLANFNTKGSMVIESKKVTMAGYKPSEGLYFFQHPNGTYGSKVHWAVLTDGNLGVTSWIPSASEKNVGLKNLCSFKHIADSGFTYASDYQDDGTFFINLVKLNSESQAQSPIKDMFGLTYDGNKRYYIFCDTFSYSSPPTADNQGTLTIYVNYTDGTRELAVYLRKDRALNNYFLTDKSVKSISGTYGYGFHPRVRLGVYETNFPVTWSPAPEDLNYIAKTYTDSEINVTKGLIESKVSQTDFDALGQVVSNQGTEISQTKTDINLVSTVSGNAHLLALTMSKGQMLYRDPEFRNGANGISVYNNNGNGTVRVERASDVNLPNKSGYKLKITTSGAATPGLGGFFFGTQTRANAVFVTRFIAWIPVGYKIEWATNAMGNGGTSKWLTNNVGTGDWEEYAVYVKCGSSGTFSSTNFFYLAGGNGSLPVVWYLAFATVYDAGSVDDTPTKDELKTGITIKPGAINIFGKDISIAGKITFSSLDSGSQSTINAASSNASSAVSTANSAASTANSAKNTADSAASSAGSALATANSAKGVADSAASAAATAKNIADSAKSGLDSLKNGLGSLAYKNLVEKAELGTTIISGGYIKSELIEVDAILAGKIGAASITTGNLTVTNGSYLGGWQIQNNAIYSRNIADAKIRLEINGYRFLRINQYGGAATVGSYPLMEIRNDNQDCLSLSTYGQGGKALRIIANSEGGHAIQSHGSHLFGQRNSESWNAPGILCGVYVYAGGTGNQFWGNGCTVGTVSNISTGRYRIYHNLGHTKYSAIIQASDDNGRCFGMVRSITSTYLEVHLVDANRGDRNVNFYLYLVGRNVW